MSLKVFNDIGNLSFIGAKQTTLPEILTAVTPPQIDGSLIFNPSDVSIYFSFENTWIKLANSSTMTSLFYQNTINHAGQPFNSFYINTSSLILPPNNGNVAIGPVCGNSITIGAANTLYGSGTTAQNLTSGNFNSIFGSSTAQNLTSGSHNVLIGTLTGSSLTSALNNTAIGDGCFTSATTASNNCIMGGGTGTGITNGEWRI